MSIKLGVLLSGSGTNLQALIDAIRCGGLDASIELVVSSRPNAYGLQRARAAHIPTLALSTLDYADPIAADATIAQELIKYQVDYVVMAGYMRMVHAPILKRFPARVINIHPALLPSFKGAHAIKEAYDAGVKVTGVTIHFADDRYDCGPIIAQQALVVDQSWSLEELEEHIHAIEHVLYPKTLQLFATKRVEFNEATHKVFIR